MMIGCKNPNLWSRRLSSVSWMPPLHLYFWLLLVHGGWCEIEDRCMVPIAALPCERDVIVMQGVLGAV